MLRSPFEPPSNTLRTSFEELGPFLPIAAQTVAEVMDVPEQDRAYLARQLIASLDDTVDAIGRVMRLCLALGVTPVFVPPLEMGFQGIAETFNGLWWEDLDTGDVDYEAVAQYARAHKLPRRFTVELALEPGTKITRSVVENHRLSREYVRRVFES